MDQVWIFAVVGFVAQLIDGSLGMAYGVSATTLLLAFGIPPAQASASVHTAKVITGALSGLAHLGFGNVDYRLFRRLAVGGVIGSIAGAYLLTRLPGEGMRPFISIFLAAMGIFIVLRAMQRIEHTTVTTHILRLGLVGGFFDAIGGGGWGPIVVTALVARGSHPRITIGSVNLAEFFVALATTLTFVATIGIGFWPAILGLGIGGALAAPVAAFLTRYIPARPLMLVVGILIVAVSVYTIFTTLF